MDITGYLLTIGSLTFCFFAGNILADLFQWWLENKGWHWRWTHNRRPRPGIDMPEQLPGTGF